MDHKITPDKGNVLMKRNTHRKVRFHHKLIKKLILLSLISYLIEVKWSYWLMATVFVQNSGSCNAIIFMNLWLRHCRFKIFFNFKFYLKWFEMYWNWYNLEIVIWMTRLSIPWNWEHISHFSSEAMNSQRFLLKLNGILIGCLRRLRLMSVLRVKGSVVSHASRNWSNIHLPK